MASFPDQVDVRAGVARWRVVVVIIGIVVLLVLGLAPVERPQRADRLPALGQPFFWAGVNYPWKSYQDFGTGAWGHSGVSDRATYDEVDTDFTNMAAQGIKVAKWRVFNDGRYGPTFDEQGFATGLAPEFYADLDAALEIASKHNIYLIFTLFNSQIWTTSCTRQGVRFGWGPAMMSDAAHRAALLHNGIEPFLRRIAKSDRVLGFEVIAEPEWGVADLHSEQDFRQKVPLVEIRSFVREVVRSIHANTKALATVESNRPRYMQYWRDLGLDYYSFSWYDWMADFDPLDVPASGYGLDRPVVLGEFPVATSQYYTIGQAMDIVHRQGYAGVFAWSFAAADQYSKWDDARQDFTAWLDQHWPEVDISRTALAPPAKDPPVTPPPYSRSEARFHMEQGIFVGDVDVFIRAGGEFVAKFFLYPGDGSSTDALAEREHFIAVSAGRSQLLSAVFDGLKDGAQYKLSLGLFDKAYNLVKWFDGLAIFTVSNGSIEEPKPTVEQIENPCYGASGS